jgi:hypothetical protein
MISFFKKLLSYINMLIYGNVITIVDEDWELLKKVRLITPPRIGEFIFLNEYYFDVVNVVHYIKNFTTIVVVKKFKHQDNSGTHKKTTVERYDSSVFTPPFRVGKKQKRAVLDSKGLLVMIMPHNSETQAQHYCNYLNGLT